ncbi:hypothetical protein [Nostoc sp.]|uniref:hypothetical protein n=1 Tax=Nostoc sp. TaxID=1180 RepID=UPI002FF64C48
MTAKTVLTMVLFCPNVSLLLGDFGKNIGEVTIVTIPFKRLNLSASPRHGTLFLFTLAKAIFYPSS